MQTQLSVLALIVGLAGAALGGYALTQRDGDSSDRDERIAALEEHVQRLERTIAQERAERVGPTLSGMPASVPVRTDAPSAAEAATAEARNAESSDDGTSAPGSSDAPATAEEIQALVDKAVDKKAEQIQVMRNKKPSLDVFAQTLQLTDVQREAAQRQILQSQRDIRGILEIQSDEGTDFLDEVVDVMANAAARPGKTPAMWGKLFSKLTTEKVPGTDETYAVRIESVKQGLRDSFKRAWEPQQYAAFQSWQMDPTEVQGIEGSPWQDLQARIVERAKELGADLPEKDDR